ncbi:linear amide C-N hydrolase [Moorena producens JHB]|uniref:Linear amide C-N hydrolase n=2 Tax=Cyanophyceae TaxID=3028117 RepID=A0A1D9G6X6_MOOP1|nr:linear amide C-N hydrolase [Moorena producens]AAS98791.1 choloylglycine hydrolase-like protein [Lyngbya majuscula]AOY83388.2 linear amide C-N hydrolase [Moorena producens JHB]
MMKKHNLIIKKVATLLVVLITILSMAVVPPAQACSRLVYDGSSNGPITARSMDWLNDPGTELWVFPKGMERDGGAGCNPITWTSKYGSIVTSSYNMGTVDGINEKGLVANLLFLTATDYGKIEPGDQTLSIGGWGQYVLDNYATVNEAVTELQQEPFRIIPATAKDILSRKLGLDIPENRSQLEFTLHLSLSDPSGDSAIFEYINGELKIHHGKEYNVLTNDPTFDEQLAINNNWNQLNDVVGGSFVPGSNHPSSRFIRASYYLGQMNNACLSKLLKNRRNELAAALGIIRNVSDPLGLSGLAISTTQWRTVSDQTNLTYFFEFTKSPNVFWVEMSKLNLEEGAPVMKLENVDSLSLVGEVSGEFQKAEPFSWDLSTVCPR